jgi:crossover junction endodeoxyribonuclease RusA
VIELRLPWPPQANNLHTVARGRKILGLAGRAYRDLVFVLVHQQLGHHEPLAGALRVTFRVYEPDRRRRDLSNLLKAAEDSLTTARVWADDSQTDDLRVLRRDPATGALLPVVPGGALVVTIEQLTEPALPLSKQMERNP